jgi:hypothetical protein
MTQQIRLSQFIFSYGPGAILEGAKGPRIIPRPDIGLFTATSTYLPEQFGISDQRMSQGLLNGARIFRLPSNSELALQQNLPVYRTKPFPYWRLCLDTGRHNGQFYVLHQGSICGVCGNTGSRRNEPIRFIVACPEGHMNDVNWHNLCHRNVKNGCPHSTWFRWYGGGGALSEIEIECPQCNTRSMNMGVAYGLTWHCNGRFPESEQIGAPPQPGTCARSNNARIVQRQASNLRLPVLRTLFSIPPRYTTLHNLLQMQSIFDNLAGSPPSSKLQLERTLKNLAARKLITSNTVNEIIQYQWDEIETAINDVLSPPPNSYDELILEEFRALAHSSTNGAPPIYGPIPQAPVIFEVDPNRVLPFTCPNNNVIRVTPVLRLRTVTVQTAYRREVDTQVPARPVDVSFTSRGQQWYPGTEFLGEGIFIRFENAEGWGFGLGGKSYDAWKKNLKNSQSYTEHVFRDPQRRTELQPLFVWWHTLSHLLIRAIAEESGYSSASIRERIYFEDDGKRVRGGILLYATQPGSEGTLGGLIALVPNFQHILNVAFDQLRTCSGDPLCIEHRFQPEQYNGAACYSCLLISETSCEHRNMWLDRNVLLENMP